MPDTIEFDKFLVEANETKFQYGTDSADFSLESDIFVIRTSINISQIFLKKE